MSRKHGGFEDDDCWDGEGGDWYDDEYYDDYDDVPQQKPQPRGGGAAGVGKGRGASGGGKAAPAGASALAHYLCNPAPKLPNGRPQKAPKQPPPVAPGPKAPVSSAKVKAFQFDTPSPDDIVRDAQVDRKIGSSQGAAGASQTTPPTEEIAAMKVVASGEVGSVRQQHRPMDEYKIDPKLRSACEAAAAGEAAEKGGRTGLHLVVLGHVDAGKSTLMGRLLHDLGLVDQRTVHRHEKEAAQAGKASFSWAWLLDERPEERSRGVTVDVATSGFQTPKFNITLLDAPGHRDFIPNMITGAAQADAALLLVDGSIGGFESGFEGNGQTREHAQLARSLGIEQIAVVVSKLDTCDFSAGRFLAIKEALAPFLKSCGFRDSLVQWLPAVGPSGENLVTPPQDPRLSEWWNGDTLVGAIDKFSPCERLTNKPLRLPISEITKSRSLGGDAVSGKMASGALIPGMQVMVQPGGQVGTVKAVEVGGAKASIARAGDSAAVGISGVDQNAIVPGVSFLCDPAWPCPVVKRLEAKVVILDVDVPILAGQPATLHANVSKEEASIARLVSLVDSKTGEVKKAKPRCLLKGQTGIVEVVMPRGLCMERYSDIRSLGRVTLRDGGKTFAVGIVQRIIS